MPIVDVEITCESEAALSETLAAEIADAAANIFDTDPGQTWVRIRPVPLKYYAENGGGPPAGLMPVFVTVLKATNLNKEQMIGEIAELTECFAAICDRLPENIHVLYEPPAAGRIAFGGMLLE